jgi:hypothetical protein
MEVIPRNKWSPNLRCIFSCPRNHICRKRAVCATTRFPEDFGGRDNDSGHGSDEGSCGEGRRAAKCPLSVSGRMARPGTWLWIEGVNLSFVDGVILRQPVEDSREWSCIRGGTLGTIKLDSKWFFQRFSLIFYGYEGYENSGESRPLCKLERRQGQYRRRVSPYLLFLCT